MINKIDNDIKQLEDKIKLIPEGCEKCDNTGRSKKDFSVCGVSFKSDYICDCQSIDGIYKYDMALKIEQLKNKKINLLTVIPKDFQENVLWKNQPTALKDFYNNDKIFCWIWSAKNGNGKTSAMYSFIMQQIINGIVYHNRVVNECNFRFDTDIKDVFIDDVFKIKIPERLKYLIPWYYNLINYKRENRQKIIFTSNISLQQFFKEIANIDIDIATAIQDRMYNVTEIIELKNDSYRKL